MAHPISEKLSERIEEVTRWFLGEPSSRRRHELRFGKHGSKAVVTDGPRRGLYFDHETGEGGDLLDLIQRHGNVDFAGAVEIAQQLVGGVDPFPQRKPDTQRKPADEDQATRTAFALRLWDEAVQINGTPAERYLAEHRGLSVNRIDINHIIKFHRATTAMVCLMTDPATGEPCGVHRTFLDVDAKKTERKMLGRQGVIRLSDDAEITTGLGICEGVEDGLAILLAGWAPVWAATSAGAIARFPVLVGIECLTVFADADAPGQAAASQCIERWNSAGREAFVGATRGGK
ncbi:toprim domain-containing protein [Hyphomicrobium sp. B1]|uniref:DUF7146 domain-containing protein n=1 Tax=Hyphomicrobium sp. B1 TaxID=3075651 RepID=UPI003C2B4CDC